MKTKIALLAAALTAAASGWAQEDTTTMTVNLSGVVSSALQYNKQLQTSAMDRELYHQKRREAMSSGLPQVSAEFTGTTYFNKALDFGGMEMSMPNSLTFAATASWTFAMQQIAGVKLAKVAERMAEQTIAQSELDVKANITDTYYAVLIYERNLDILNDNMADMKEIAKHTAHSYEVGVAERTDVDQININVITLQNAIISLERNLESTKRLLVLQMGVPINTRIKTEETLEQVLLASPLEMDTTKFDINNNVQYKQLLINREIQEGTVKVKKFAYIPTLTAAYQYSNAIKGGFMNFNHVGTLKLSIPIFSGFNRHSQLKQAQIEVQRNEKNIELMEDNLAQNAEQYAYEFQTAVDAYNLQKENLEVAKRVLQNYRNKYDQGVLSSLDLTQANTNYLQAETSYASACMDVLTAQTKLLKLYNLL